MSNYAKFVLHEIHSKWLFHITCCCFFLAYNLLRFTSKRDRAIEYLMKAHRIKPSPMFIKSLKRELENGYTYSSKSNLSFMNTLERSIVLSLPKFEGDTLLAKGALLITFTDTFAHYLSSKNYPLIDKYFVLILEPSWAGYADPEIIGMIQKTENCVVMATELSDRALLNSLFPNLPVATFGASNWVSPEIFKPSQPTKEFDSIYVANMNPIKRIYRYIDAVANVVKRSPEYRGCLVCARHGGNTEDVKSYIKKKGLGANLLYIPGLEREQLVETVQKAKVSVLLSFKEGSNRTLFESMFLNVPVICLYENTGVNKEYINENTGLLIGDAQLEGTLYYFQHAPQHRNPRSWALEYLAPDVTTKQLSVLIKNRFGESCVSDLRVKVNSPEVAYIDGGDHIYINKELFAPLDRGDELSFMRSVEELSSVGGWPNST